MWILVHVTDSVRATDAVVTHPPSRAVRGVVAAAEGMAAPVSDADEADLARRRHRKAHRRLARALVLRKRAHPAA